MHERKVLLIGIDGATWDVIKPWIAQKKLPAFAELLDSGIHGDLESTTPPISPSAWASIFTGTVPGKHNIFRFVKQKEDSYFVSPISSMDRRATPIWRLVSETGGRCIMLNIPFAYPPDSINGIMTTGLGTPSKNSAFTYPGSFRKELFRRFPKYDVDFNEDEIILGSSKNPQEQIWDITGEHINCAKHLLREEGWDLFCVVFRSTDVIQHYYWNDREAVLRCYQQMDGFLKWVLDNIDEDTTLFVCSDHGFAPVHTNVYITNWLERQNLLRMRRDASGRREGILPSAETFEKILLRLGFKNLVWRMKRSKRLESILGRVIVSERAKHIFNIQWHETSAYFLEASFGMINVNLMGRESEGCVKKEDWEDIRDDIIRGALELKNPANGEKVIVGAYRGEEIYDGSSENIPDIILIRKSGYRLMGGYDYSGNIFKEETTRVGDHERYGILVVCGSGIREGTEIRNASVYDITPTILFILDIDVPKDIDGKVLKDLFGDNLKEKRDGKTMVGRRERKHVGTLREKAGIREHVENLARKGRI